MLKKTVLLLLFSCATFAQTNQLWQSYFSYNNIKDVANLGGNVVAATENALFYKNFITNELKTITTVDGFKAENITAIYYQPTLKLIFVGNEKGMLLIHKADGTVLQKRGIIDEVPVPPSIKQINHFYEYNNKIYIATNYGISVFKLDTMEFGETYYMGPNGNTTKVLQIAVKEPYIYAATEYNGIRRALISSQFLDDYNQWSQLLGDYFKGVVSFANEIYCINSSNAMERVNNMTNTVITTFPENVIDFRNTEDYVIVTTQNHVYVYNTSLVLVFHFQSTQNPKNPKFTCTTIVNNTVYIGTTTQGILTIPLNNSSQQEFVLPNGPFRNSVFRIKKASKYLWATYGTYDPVDYNPYYDGGPHSYPMNKYSKEAGWELLDLPEIFNARCMTRIILNPKNDNDFFVGSSFSGLLKFVNNTPTILYDDTNTGSDPLQPLETNGDQIRVNGGGYDSNGDLWFTTSLTTKGLNILKKNGQLTRIDLTPGVSEPYYEQYPNMVIDKNNTKWLASYRSNGVIGYNEKNNKFVSIKMGTEGNLPFQDTRALAIDNKNQLWIGTIRGLRVVQTDAFFSDDQIQSKSIIILENGQAQELFYDQFITDIEVDGANRKWVSLADAGVYLVSPDGQNTIYHFTKDNSPLPSNNINDIDIDGVTGEVFFATDKGLVSFKGTATKASDNLNNVFVYPNPVRPEFTGTVKIAALTNKANVKITDIEGNLVFETTSEGGTVEWDTTAFGSYKVASGVYMVFISAEDGIETTVKKIMIVR